VAQQFLQREQIDARLQQMGGVTVPQRVQTGLLGDTTGNQETPEQTLHTAGTERLGAVAPWEQPGTWLILPPVATQ